MGEAGTATVRRPKAAPTTPERTDRDGVADGRGVSDGTAGRLVAFALANVRRRPERSVLAVAGIALAITAVVVVRTIAASYQTTGADAVAAAIDGAPYWVVPEGGAELDAERGVIVTAGPPPSVEAPAGWTATEVLVGTMPGHEDVALVGRSGPTGATDEATATRTALDRLGLDPGDSLEVGGRTVTVRSEPGSGARLTVPHDLAVDAGIRNGWTTLTPPGNAVGTGDEVVEATGLDVVTDPSRQPTPGSGGLIYSTTGSTSRGGIVSFDQKMAALLGGRVASSTLGLVSQIGLVLGFVIAVSTFVAAVQERRREFGIMASVGLTDEVLYFFLVEALLLFVAAYVLGVVAAGALVAVVTPSFFTVGSWLSAAAMVAMYLPALAIVAALVPVHRLLQQRPVALLADEA